MADLGAKWKILRSVMMIFVNFALAFVCVKAERGLKIETLRFNGTERQDSNYLLKAVNFLWQPEGSGYHHVWPELKFGWQIVLGTIIGFFGAAFGSVGGVGGGGIFVPMLSLIVGFDPKSATAISKCMIMGAAVSTVYYNLKLRHPTLDMPIIDYDLALLIQPMLMLGISIGVAFNVIFADWMVTVLLIVLFIGTSTKAFLKGVETWKRETILKKEAARCLGTNGAGAGEVEYKPLPSGPRSGPQKDAMEPEVTILENVYWKELGLLLFVWVAFLGLQIAKNHTASCSIVYWVLDLLQIPVSLVVSLYEAISLYKGRRVIASKGDDGNSFRVFQLVSYCAFGVLAGIVGGLLGLGGGFIMGPLFLELGVPPQVSSATATFAMTFSSSMSVVEYYLLKRFPVPYALYFVAVATIAAFVGQHVVRKLIILLGRASLIIFILAFMIFVSAISLGGVGISNMIEKIHWHEYMGFENLCNEIVTWLLESSALLVNPCPSSGRTAESAEYKPLPGKQTRNLQKVTILENIRWKELGFLSFIRLAYLVPQIAKKHTATFSSAYWVLNSLHVPVSVGVFLYEAIGLYEGRRVIASKGEEGRNCSLQQLVQWCACGIVAGLLGIDGGFITGPLFLELGCKWPSAAAIFGMTFSPSMSVVEFYLPNGFPVPYALYFIAVAVIAAFTGTYIMNNMIASH